MSRLILFFVFCSLTASLQAQAAGKQDTYTDIIHYEFNLTLNDTSNMIEGKAVIDLNLGDQVNSFDIDLEKFKSTGKGMKIRSVSFNGSDAGWEHTNDRIRIMPGVSMDGRSSNEITILYSGIPSDGLIISKNKYGNRTFFADHWPDRASRYLPVSDQSSDKATVDFVITAPFHYEVVASGYMVEESGLPGGLKLTHWKEDVPVPVKVMAFGAADFATQLAGTVNNIPVWTWVFPENREAGFHDYSVATKPLAFYCDLIGPYSYEKLANVQSKTIFGGLENAGCIFYSEKSVTGEGKAENLIAHEIAHQWFGNSVTEACWHHIWLSEGFATYLAAVYMEMNYGHENMVESMRSARSWVIKYYEKTPAPVIDTTITNLMKLLNPNSYQKGAWILHMLRFDLGEENFWKGIRLYYEKYRNGIAYTEDFREAMEETSGKDLKKFFYQWLYIPGQPDLMIKAVRGKKKGTSDIVIEQRQDYLFSFNLEIMLKDSNGTRTIMVPVSERSTRVNVDAEPDAELIPDPDVRLLFRSVQK